MATAKVVISDKIEFAFSYTFNASYSDTNSRVSTYISSATSASTLSHPYSGILSFLVDGELAGGFGLCTISKSGKVSVDSFGTINTPIEKQHSARSHSLGFEVSLVATDGSGVSHDKTTTVSVTVPAKTSYTVGYNSNGGSGAPSSQTKWHGESLTLSSTKPTRTGYAFYRWTTKADGSGSYYSSGGAYTTNAAATLYAQWTLNTYTITYALNGGSGTFDNQTKTYGKTLTLRSGSPTRSGYVFNGWKATNGTVYQPGGSYTANSATTLTAQWLATYTISYSASGASNVPSSQTKTHGVNLTLRSNVPTKTNYVFANWKATNGTTYSPGGSYTANASTTMTAQWYNPYTVTFNANGGTGGPTTQTKVYNSPLTLSSSIPTRSNHTFSTWNTKSDGTGTNYAPESQYTANANLTLYAKWTKAYESPTLTIKKIYRADSSGDADDEGTYLALECSYSVYNTGSNSFTWLASCNSVSATTPTSGGSAFTGDAKFILNAGLSADQSYEATVKLTDSAAGAPSSHSATIATQTRSIGTAYYPIDLYPGGGGIAFGGVAKRSGWMDVGGGFSVEMLPTSAGQYHTNDMAHSFANPTESGNAYGNSWYCNDSRGTRVGYAQTVNTTAGVYRSFAVTNPRTGNTMAIYLHSDDDGTISASLYGSGTWEVADIPELPASKITSGTFDVARIPGLAASKITSGTFDADRIPNLAAGKITSGTLGADRIPGLAASKITSGTFDADRIPGLAAGKITSGTFAVARIPSLTLSKISDSGTLAGKDSGSVNVAASMTTETFTKTYTIAASTTATIEITGVSKTNYTFAGLRRLTTGVQGSVGVTGWYLDGTTLNVYVRNYSTSQQASKTCSAVVCWVQTASLSRSVTFS